MRASRREQQIDKLMPKAQTAGATAAAEQSLEAAAQTAGKKVEQTPMFTRVVAGSRARPVQRGDRRGVRAADRRGEPADQDTGRRLRRCASTSA